MLVVADANVLFSFFRKTALVRALILAAGLENDLEVFSPDIVVEELESHKKEICLKAGISEAEFEFPMAALESSITIVERESWAGKLEDASSALPSHVKDAPYLALAMKLGAPIWSYDKNLKKQAKVEVLTTKELLAKLKPPLR